MSKNSLKCDLEHTYEFTNMGDDWTRADGSIVVNGQSFRALSTELDEIEEKSDQFRHERTLPFPPADLLRAMTPAVGFQRKHAEVVRAVEQQQEQPKGKKNKKSEATRKAHVG